MTTPASRPRKSPARRPGRPPAGETDIRARLLDVAIDLFARHGIAATSLKRIAAEAGVTPALVHYYFGSREQLLDVVVSERLLPPLGNVLQGLQSAGSDPAALVPAFVRGITGMLAANPWLPPLWVREVLGEGGELRARLQGNVRLFAPILRDRFAAAQQAGHLNAGLDPRLLLVSLIGLTVFPFAAQPVWRGIFAADDIDHDAMIRHTLALLTRGLEMKS